MTEQLNDIPQSEVAAYVARLRQIDELFFIWILIATLIITLVAMPVFAEQTKFHQVIFFIVFALAVLLALGVSKYVIEIFWKYQCPRCGNVFTAPSRYDPRSLYKEKCDHCGISFEDAKSPTAGVQEPAGPAFGNLSFDAQDVVINQQIQLAEDNQSRYLSFLLWKFVSGVVFVLPAMGVWIHRNDGLDRPLLFVALIGGVSGCLALRSDKKREAQQIRAKCPQCGYNWEFRREIDATKCEKCPNCGVRMAAARHFG